MCQLHRKGQETAQYGDDGNRKTIEEEERKHRGAYLRVFGRTIVPPPASTRYERLIQDFLGDS